MFKNKAETSVPSSKSSYTTYIDEGTEIEGKFSFTGTVLVNGRLRGEISSNDHLVVGERANINATIRASVVQISGEVVGDVMATGRVEIKGTAPAYGGVEAPVVVIEDGALFEGHCRMVKTQPAEAAPMARDASVV